MDRYKIISGTKVDLSQWDARDKSAFDGGKKDGRDEVADLNTELEGLQELLYAEGKHKILIVLQGMDTAGKDGVIRRVFEGVNPQGVKVASFKVPTAEELSRDYLWRIHKMVPGKGEIVIFNRSHYEDVLVVRVHGMVSPELCRKRYKEIVDFERMLAANGTLILKFYLNISLEEQKERLQARLDDPQKIWKFNPGDLAERKLWPDYMTAYEEAIEATSTDFAPWYIIPSDRKWYRDLVIATLLVKALKDLKMSFPPPEENLDNIVIE
jgi:PPK2 family polyphosphate:nucleotide phosphotransferase